MHKTLLAYDIVFQEGMIIRKHEWHEDTDSANRRTKYLLKLNKDKERTIKYKHFVIHYTTMQQIKHHKNNKQ